MSVLEIRTDLGESPWTDLREATERGEIPHGIIERVGVLPEGMTSGLPSVAVVIRLDNGSLVLAEVSLRHFQMANAAFMGRYGEAAVPSTI